MEYDEKLDDFEDIDLLELIMSDSNSTNQYLVFEGSNSELYAINVSKVVEILVYKNLEMVRNGLSESIIIATAKIRDQMATIVNFDEWFGNKILDEKDYEYIVLASFGGHNLGIMIKAVEYVLSIDSAEMINNAMNNQKTNFIANIKLSGINRLCTIFDCDKLLVDVFGDSKNNTLEHISFNNKVVSNNIVLFADDSIFIRKMVKSMFDQLGLNYKIFENGQDLLTELKLLSPKEIGLIVTDIEMPVMDGIHLIKEIRSLDKYDEVAVIVHTNMSNFIIEDSLTQLGVDEIIPKIDMQKLSENIVKYFKI